MKNRTTITTTKSINSFSKKQRIKLSTRIKGGNDGDHGHHGVMIPPPSGGGHAC